MLLFSSFERASPALPAVFEYNGLKYIDTARVEPKVAYSPQKTPPKTPETPHFSHTPFINPGNNTDGTQVWPQPGQVMEMKDMPVATSERKPAFELENLEGSPGNTLRERNRRINSPPTSPIQDLDDDERLEMLQESPGSRNRRRNAENLPVSYISEVLF